MKKILFFCSFLILSHFVSGQDNTVCPAEQEKLGTPVSKERHTYPESEPPTSARFTSGVERGDFPTLFPRLRNNQQAYAWVVYQGAADVPEGPVHVDLQSGLISSIAEVDGETLWMAGADIADDIWYAVSHSGSGSGLYTIHPITGEYEFIGSTGQTLTSLAYNPINGTMYASGLVGEVSRLFTINLQTGAATLVGTIINGLVIGLAGDAQGNLYALTIDNNGLFSVNPNTGQGTWIGQLGLNVNYAQDLAFDRDNGILYGTLFNGLLGGALYSINTDNAQDTFINSYYAQVAGFAIPYSWAPSGAPAAVSSFMAQPGAQGQMHVSLSWTNPTLQFSGETLTELTSVVVERNGTVIHTIENPTTGAAEVFTDNDIDEEGVYWYRVYGINAQGQGAKTSEYPFVGFDRPAAPGIILLTAQDDVGYITWNSPNEGLYGGYIDPLEVTYSVYRMPGKQNLVSQLPDNFVFDANIPDRGHYYYLVKAENNQGVGGSNLSNVELLQGGHYFFYETFDQPLNIVPVGWHIETDGQQINWRVNNENTAGGTAPQMRLDYLPRFEGTARLISRPINTDGYAQARLLWRQYLGQWMDFVDGNIAVEVSFDDGITWQVLYEQDVEGDIPATREEIFVDIPSGIESMRIAFRFIGVNFAVYEWDIDDITLEPVYDHDLKAVSIDGSRFPTQGIENIYTVKVRNLGTLTQSDYTVKLMKEDGTELVSVDGLPIEFSQTISYNLAWIPEAGDPDSTAVYGLVVLAEDQLLLNNQTSSINIVTQPSGTWAVSIGDGDFLTRDPYNFIMHHSLNQTIYYQEEIAMGGGQITAIQYYNNFRLDYMDKNIKIWMGETEQVNLVQGWISPSTLTLVFDGTVDFPEGQNSILIELDTPFEYNGGNLVIYNSKADDVWTGLQNFYNTVDQGSFRGRRAHRDNNPFDPMYPDLPGTAVHHFPNITMFFSTDGMGTVSGTVTDGENPMEGVRVRPVGSHLEVFTHSDGTYQLPFLPEGTYEIEFSRYGYGTVVVEDVVITDGENTIVNTILTALTQHEVSGVVEGNDGLLIENATVTLDGPGFYTAVTNENGAFVMEDVFAGSYTLRIEAAGYDLFLQEDVLVEGDTSLGTLTIIKTLGIPGALSIDMDQEGEGDALLSWHLGFNREFRWDDGVITGQLGAQNGTISSVLGSVHRHKATLHQMSWYLTDLGGPHLNIAVWVIGLDQNGHPNRNDIIYSMGNVPNVDHQWNTYEFSTPVHAPNGFFVGVSYNGFIGLGMDSGNDDVWGFQELTHYASTNINSVNFSPIENFGFYRNFAIRAFGADFQELEFGTMATTAPADPVDQGAFSFGKLEREIVTNGPLVAGFSQKEHKDLIGFNVFLNDLENPVAQNVPEMEYFFEGLAEGDYVAGVQSVYPTGMSDVVTLAFEMLHGVPVTIVVETNSGDSPNGAHVLLTSNENDQDMYEHVVGPNGQAFFHNVYKGSYTLQVTRDHFHQYFTTVQIDDPLTYTVVLVEIIADPFGLEVTTEGLAQGEALFSWNNDPEKALLGYTVYLNNVPVATQVTETSYLFTGLPVGQHTAGVRAHFTTGNSGRVTIPFTIVAHPDLTKPVTFTVIDQTQNYQALRIKGEMTTPQWEDVSLNQGPPHFWTITLNALPGTYQWGITEDDGSEHGIWLLPEGENLVFTLGEDGSVSGTVSYILTTVGVDELANHQFRVFPNPASDRITLESSVIMTEVMIMDIAGRIVFAGNPGDNTLHILTGEMDRGIYFIQAFMGDQLIIRKLILQ